jgi:hypothetical protein
MAQPNYRLAGNNPFAYMGVEPYTPPGMTLQTRRPKINDTNFNIGQFWIWRDQEELWVLINLNQGVATWIMLESGAGGANEFPTDLGTAFEVDQTVNVFGLYPINTTGSGNTVTILLENGSDGQVLIGGGSGSIWNNITSSDGSITVTNGANSIDIVAENASIVTSIISDDGTVLPASGLIQIDGGELINTSGSSNTVIVNFDRSDDGKIPIAATGAPTIFAHITSSDGTVDITNSSNGIDLSIDFSDADVNPAANCNFFMYQSSNVVIGIPGGASLGNWGALTIKYDVGGNCYPGSGAGRPFIESSNWARFVAPATGKYVFGTSVTAGPNSNTGQPVEACVIVNNNQAKSHNFDTPSFPQVPPISTITNRHGTSIVACNAGDWITVTYSGPQVPGSGMFIRGSSVSNVITYFWGYRIV